MNVLKNKIVHCKNEEEAKKLMQIAEDEGYMWCDGIMPTSCTSWYIIGKNGIAYFFDYEEENNITYELYDWLNNKNKSKMIEFTDLFTTEDYKGNIKVTKYNTTLGEKILVKDQEDDDWQERYFLTVAHGYVYTTATEEGNGEFATAWKYGIKIQ